MRDYQREGVQPATALEALRDSYNNTDLTQLARHCVGPKPPTRKDHLLAILMQLLEGENLKSTWASSANAKKPWPRKRRGLAPDFWMANSFKPNTEGGIHRSIERGRKRRKKNTMTSAISSRARNANVHFSI